MKNLKTKIILIFLLVSFVSISFPKPTSAGWWGEPMMAVEYQITVEKMLKSIQDTIIANLKMAALRIIQTRLMSLLQSTGVPMDGVAGAIISDWKMFIFSSATKYSTAVTNDFFRNLQAGSTSAMNQYIIGPARNAVNTDYYNMRPDLQNYCPGGDPTKAFNSGTSNQWMCWHMSGAPQNDLATTVLRAESAKQAAYNQEAAAKQAEGQAGAGYAGKVTAPGAKDREVMASNGKMLSAPASSSYQGQNITTTGSDIKALANDVVIHMKTQMLSMAQSIPEIATAMVNQMIAQVIQQGASQLANPGSGGGFSLSSMAPQMQSMIQNGVRQAASPNTFFGSGGSSSFNSGSNAQPSQSGQWTIIKKSETTNPSPLPSDFNRGGQD